MENINLGAKKKVYKERFLFSKPLSKTTPIRLSKIKYQEKVVQIKRVTKVVKGGKNLSYRALVIVGDMKSKVGLGIGKAADASVAIDKAILLAKKQLVSIPLTKSLSIPISCQASIGASTIILRPTSAGNGVIAGGAVRAILELGGIKNALGKQLGSNNLLNNAKATIKAINLINEAIDISKFISNKGKKFYHKLAK